MFQVSDLDMLHKLQDKARTVRAMIYDRAVISYWQAIGQNVPTIGRTLDGCHLHNSLVSLENGKPWPEINYRAMRLAKHLLDRSFEPDRIVQRWYQRKCRSVA